jgi:hypothetical protein
MRTVGHRTRFINVPQERFTPSHTRRFRSDAISLLNEKMNHRSDFIDAIDHLYQICVSHGYDVLLARQDLLVLEQLHITWHPSYQVPYFLIPPATGCRWKWRSHLKVSYIDHPILQTPYMAAHICDTTSKRTKWTAKSLVDLSSEMFTEYPVDLLNLLAN